MRAAMLLEYEIRIGRGSGRVIARKHRDDGEDLIFVKEEVEVGLWVGLRLVGLLAGDAMRIALRGCLPGLAPAGHFLSLLRQRKEAKKGDRYGLVSLVTH